MPVCLALPWCFSLYPLTRLGYSRRVTGGYLMAVSSIESLDHTDKASGGVHHPLHPGRYKGVKVAPALLDGPDTASIMEVIIT